MYTVFDPSWATLDDWGSLSIHHVKQPTIHRPVLTFCAHRSLAQNTTGIKSFTDSPVNELIKTTGVELSIGNRVSICCLTSRAYCIYEQIHLICHPNQITAFPNDNIVNSTSFSTIDLASSSANFASSAAFAIDICHSEKRDNKKR